MKKSNAEFVSSRKTPALKSLGTYDHSNLFEHMFMEDYTTGFSYHFMELNRDFYKTKPIDCELSRLLEHERYNYLGYEFQNVIMRIFRHMLLRGKAYVEIEEIKEKDKLVGINFILISAKKRFEVGKNIFFVGIGQDDKKARFSVPKTHILKFNMKSLGFKENYYASKRKKMKKLDIIGYTNLTLDPKMNGIYDFSLVSQKIDKQKIKILKELGWIARDVNNKSLSEMYMLYQRARFLDFMWNSMEYIIRVINAGLQSLFGNKEMGEIVVDIEKREYFTKFAECCEEKISIDELSTYLYKRE